MTQTIRSIVQKRALILHFSDKLGFFTGEEQILQNSCYMAQFEA